MIFTLRLMEYGDIEWLRDLRNVSRAEFFDHREVTPEAQEAWWRSAQYGDERWVITAPSKTVREIVSPLRRRVGYFSVVSPKPDLPVFPTDGRPVRYFSTMMVAPEHRGEGAILTATAAFDTVSFCYSGYVCEGNHKSLRACSKLGFKDRGRYKHPSYGYIHLMWLE